MGALIYQWIDLVWLPIAWFAVHKQHRVKAVAFVLTCMLTMRTQVELMESFGFDDGFLPVMDTSLFSRGLIVYSIVTALYLVLAHYSPGTSRIVFFAASLTIYVFAFCVSMIVMIL